MASCTHRLALLLVALAAWALPSAMAIRDNERTFAMIGAQNSTGGQWRLQLSTGNKALPNNGWQPVSCNSTVAGGCANSYVIQQDRGDMLRVNYTLVNPRGPAGTLRTFNGLQPTRIMVRLCYSLGHAVDRAWRKKNKVYPRLSQNCPRDAGSVPFVGGVSPVDKAANSGVAIFDFDLEDEIPTSAWFVMLWVYCGTEEEEVCAFETTESGPQINYIETQEEMGITPGMRAAAIVLSIFSPSFLILYFVADHFYYKRTGKTLRF